MTPLIPEFFSVSVVKVEYFYVCVRRRTVGESGHVCKTEGSLQAIHALGQSHGGKGEGFIALAIRQAVL